MSSRLILMLFAILIINGCDQKASEPAEGSSALVSEILATVNGEAITQQDVDSMIQRTFSDFEQALLNKQTQGNVLQSLIASKAMQQVMRQELSKQQIELIENKTKAYQEELYVKEYLLKNATLKPVSTKAIQSYYERNIEEFGGGESTTIELLKSASKPTESQRDAILTAVAKLKLESDWSKFANTNTDLGLQHFRSVVQPGLFDPVIEQTIKPLKRGDVSGVVFVKQIPHIIKIVDKQAISAKPLASVSAIIRKKLAAVELKKAIKDASDGVVQKVDVQIQ